MPGNSAAGSCGGQPGLLTVLSRRNFLWLSAAGAVAAPRLTPKERVDRTLRGQDVDRTPFRFWHHFGLQKFPGHRHAQFTREFHLKLESDLGNLMSYVSYPRP